MVIQPISWTEPAYRHEHVTREATEGLPELHQLLNQTSNHPTETLSL